MAYTKGVLIVLNNITGNIKSDEWYTPVQVVKKCFELLNVQQNQTLMLPFDTVNSNFVKEAIERNCRTIYGITDYLTSDYDYDLLMTNPPFSIKDQVIEKVLKDGKPALLLLPGESLGGVKRHKLFSEYGYPSIYVPTRRIHYIDGSGLNRKGSYFHTIMMLLNVGKSEIIWEN